MLAVRWPLHGELMHALWAGVKSRHRGLSLARGPPSLPHTHQRGAKPRSHPRWEPCAHHVLHVGGQRVHLAPKFVVKHEDLLLVRPGDGPPHPGVGLVLLVFTEQLLQVRDIGQEEALGPTDQQHQPHGDNAVWDTAHGSTPAASLGRRAAWTSEADVGTREL